jgi:hypothetical protein
LFVTEEEPKGGNTHLTIVKVNENYDPNGGVAELERLRRLHRELAPKVNRKTKELIGLRLAVTKAKRLALLREAEWRRQKGGGGR